jgi:hypothetical protein
MESAAVPAPQTPLASLGSGVEDKGLKLLHLSDRPVLVVPAEEE